MHQISFFLQVCEMIIIQINDKNFNNFRKPPKIEVNYEDEEREEEEREEGKGEEEKETRKKQKGSVK